MGDDVRGKAGEVSGAAGEQGKQVAQRAGSEASQVPDTAKDQARQVKDGSFSDLSAGKRVILVVKDDTVENVKIAAGKKKNK